jgi:hypothetical protein
VATYLPTANLSPLLNFFQYGGTGTTAALQTALNGVYSGIQVFADGASGNTGNALVVIPGQAPLSVKANYYVGQNEDGQWVSLPAAKLAGGAASKYTAYSPS